MTQSAEKIAASELAEVLWTAMQQGVAPWQKSWSAAQAPMRPMNFVSGREYRGANSLYLMMVAMCNGWSNSWLSFLESTKLGGNLKGQKGTRIDVPMIRKKVDDQGNEVEKLTGFRGATVFNLDQSEGCNRSGFVRKEPINVIASVDTMLNALVAQGMRYEEPSDDGGCWYLPMEDHLGMPKRDAFVDTYSFYSALVHEMAHATMRQGRVERESVSFAYEELRAEIASTLLCSTLSLPRTQAHVDNHAAYIQVWLNDFADQKTLLMKAASEAQKMHDYLFGLIAMNANLQKVA